MSENLQGESILITSGPTRANIDAVRFITNRSSGRLGCAIATEAISRGAQVTMVTGPDSRKPDVNSMTRDVRDRLKINPIETVGDLIDALEQELTDSSVYSAVIHAMAVLDYVPEKQQNTKVRSGKEQWTLHLKRTPKVINKIKEWSPDSYLVGFKLEVNKVEEDLRRIGDELKTKTGADLVVANDITDIRDERHPALLIGDRGQIVARPQTKSDIASKLCDVVAREL